MKKYTIALIWLTAIGLIAMVLFSCSASYHFGKFIKKGGTIDTTERIITTTKTIRINGKDSIITVRVPVTCPEIQIPPTRTEIRYKYKLDKKALQVMKSMYEDSLKEARKINASNNDRIKYVTKWKTKEVVKVAKTESKNVWNWFWIGLAVGILIPILFKFVIKKI